MLQADVSGIRVSILYFDQILGKRESQTWLVFNLTILWRRGVVVITTAQLHLTKAELRFCAGSNSACGVSEIRDGEDLWQCSGLGIRVNAFRRSTIPRKQSIIIIKLFASIKFCQNSQKPWKSWNLILAKFITFQIPIWNRKFRLGEKIFPALLF